MNIKMKLGDVGFDAKLEDLNKNPQLSVSSNCNDLTACFLSKTKMDDGGTIFNISLEFNEESFIQYEVKIDELELFANSILKSIEIVRRDYSEHIRYQANKLYYV